MKIDSSFKSIKTPAGQETQKVSEVKSAKNETLAQQTSADVQLSPLMSHLKQTEASLTQEPSFDQARVNEIREAIMAGKFTINAEAIADRLLQNATEWLGSPS